ncbi:MAG: DUF2791 family P-loop domain-containing protein [Dehalococcoidales bacterium]|nr:DUF2791 family P-loop domain-containing protein [Dehalococcoidales bacterium]
MIYTSKIENRRAVEALRSGVPNRDAVRAMGSSQPVLEKAFKSRLQVIRDDPRPGRPSQGMLIAGGFGAGKSHLLEYFKHISLEENFICSKIVISKETPLYNPAKVFQAALESAAVPERRGSAVNEIAARLDYKSEAYARLVRWVNSVNSGLSSQFAATLYLYEYARGDDEIRDRILRFWAGDPLNVTEIRKSLRELGEAATYKIEKIAAKELAQQRYAFILQLMLTAGYSGWTILVDEVELIGRYSLKQRARSYAEIARLMGKIEGTNLSELCCILSISDDFESAVMDYRADEEKIPTRFSQSSRPDDVLMTEQAERGMQLIRRNKIALERMNPGITREMFDKLRRIYASAYDWEPGTDYIEPDVTARIRQHIKRWIMEWDLKRLNPDYRPQIENSQLSPVYTEIPELAGPEPSEKTDNRDVF